RGTTTTTPWAAETVTRSLRALALMRIVYSTALPPGPVPAGASHPAPPHPAPGRDAGGPRDGVDWKQMHPLTAYRGSADQTQGRRRRLCAPVRTALLVILAAAAALTGLPPGTTTFSAPAEPGHVLLIHVEGLITAGTAAFVQGRIGGAPPPDLRAVVIRLDTPGGLVDPTLDILQAISAAAVPVITYVGPEGAIAASAGSFILVGGHVAAMAPGTTTGAAMPVAVDPTGGETQPADEKTVNFLAGHLRSVARERGRPPDVVERFITENLTLDAHEALAQ